MSELNRTVSRIENSPRSLEDPSIDTLNPQVGFKNRRVDPPHPLRNVSVSNRDADKKSQADCREATDRSAEMEVMADLPLEDHCHAERERLLRLHAADLIKEIQGWADDLERRESQLNTRDALLDERQRQLRTWEKFKRQELDDTSRLTDRLQQEAKERLKRIAAVEF